MDDYEAAEAHFGPATRVFRVMFYALAAVEAGMVGVGLAAGWEWWWTAPYGLLSLASFLLARGIVVKVHFRGGGRWSSQDAGEIRRFRRRIGRE